MSRARPAPSPAGTPPRHGLHVVSGKGGTGKTTIAAALAAYLPGHFDPREALGTVLAGVLVSVFLGGGAGLLLGAIATWLTRRT